VVASGLDLWRTLGLGGPSAFSGWRVGAEVGLALKGALLLELGWTLLWTLDEALIDVVILWSV
jgi:hypothetical protein